MRPIADRRTRTAALLIAASAALAAPIAAAAPASAAPAKTFPMAQWRYVGSFPDFVSCNSTGHWLVLIRNARDYRCLDGRDGSDLYTLSSPRI